jgi:hypothetical protein
MKLYKELGYDGMMMPDHVPKSPDDPRSARPWRTATATSRR